MQGLQDSIRRLIDQSGADAVGVALLDTCFEKKLLVNGDAPFHPASTFKVCVMVELHHQAREGLLALEDEIPVKNEFHSIVDGSVYALDPRDDSETDLYAYLGRKLPARDLIERMITQSSNLATNILIEKVTPQKVAQYMKELGSDGLMVRRGVEDNKAFALGWNNAATAGSMAHLLLKMALGEAVSPADSEGMVAVLKRQRFNDGIPALLPKETEAAHKTGWNGLLYHDAGILFPPGQAPYVLAVFTRGLADTREGPAFVAALSKIIYDNLAEWRG